MTIAAAASIAAAGTIMCFEGSTILFNEPYIFLKPGFNPNSLQNPPPYHFLLLPHSSKY
jgi:hypothetical protein